MSDVTPSPTTIFLLAENRLLGEALVRILSKKPDLTVVRATAFTPVALDELVASKADIVLLDSPSLAFSGPHLVMNIRRLLPDAGIVMIGMERDEATFLRAVREGVMGYALKDASAMEIVSAIRGVVSGEAVCPPCFSRAIFQCAAQQLAVVPEITGIQPNGLSPRENQLVSLVRLGLRNKEIAARLNLSERTVKNHVHRIFRKVGVRDRMTMVERCQANPEINVPGPEQ